MFGRRASQWTCFHQKCWFCCMGRDTGRIQPNPSRYTSQDNRRNIKAIELVCLKKQDLKIFLMREVEWAAETNHYTVTVTYVWILNPKSPRRAEPGIDSHHHPARGSVCEYGAGPTNPPENGRLHSSLSSILSSYTSFYKSLYIWDDCHHAHFVLNHHLIDATHAVYGWAGFHWRRFWFSVLLEESWVTVKLDLERKTQQTEEGHVGWSCFRREVKQCWQRQKVLCENKALRWASFGYYSFISWESNAIYFVFMTWERRNYH